MKKLIKFVLVILVPVSLQAQTYLIDFTASGITNEIDSIFIENITQGYSLTISGGDTLKLFGTAGIYQITNQKSLLKIYPNPFDVKAQIEFYSNTYSTVEISINNVNGNLILKKSIKVNSGLNILEITDIPRGYYVLTLKTDNQEYRSVSFISINNNTSQPDIYLKENFITKNDYILKSSKNQILLSYNTGDQMFYIAYSGIYSEHKYDIPTSSKTINFEFSTSSCGGVFTDSRDNNSYNSVRIGKQCWMKENLKYLPEVSPSSTQSSTEKYYYVYGYQGNDVTEAKQSPNYNTFGVLYNWTAAVDGNTGSNINPSNLQGACPQGWHLPSYSEWNQLLNFAGGAETSAPKLKSTDLWAQPNNHTNETNFSALPGGVKYYDGNFYLLITGGDWWSSSEEDNILAYDLNMDYNRDDVATGIFNKNIGAAVRCVKD